jgi:hypothetical protein
VGKKFSVKGLLRETFSLATLKWMAVYYGVFTGVYAGSGLMLPSAEDYLRERGVDPAAARSVSDMHIRIRTRNFLGTAHTYLGGHFKDEGAFAETGTMLYHVANLCFVRPDDSGTTMRDWLADAHSFRRRDVEFDPLTARETELATLFHEFRHCNHRQDSLSDVMSEADADAYGFWKAAEIAGNPEVIIAHIHIRALNLLDPTHDTVLYIDAKRRGIALPDEKEMSAAREEVLKKTMPVMMRLVMRDLKRNPALTAEIFNGGEINREKLREYLQKKFADGAYYTVTNAKAMEILLKNGTEFSPPARRRAELYVAGARYYMPRSMGVKAATFGERFSGLSAPPASKTAPATAPL